MIIENDGVVCSSVDVVSVLTTIVVSAMCMSDVFVTILFVMFTLFFCTYSGPRLCLIVRVSLSFSLFFHGPVHLCSYYIVTRSYSFIHNFV